MTIIETTETDMCTGGIGIIAAISFFYWIKRKTAIPSKYLQCFYMCSGRPRVLYGAVFAWLALSGGRFTAPFLQSEVMFSDSLTGFALAIQMITLSLLGSFGGALADTLERHKRHGRADILCIGISIGTLSFLLHGVGDMYHPFRLDQALSFTSVDSVYNWSKYEILIVSWHICMRVLYAIGLSLTMPVLDGLTLSHLKEMEGCDETDYGKERLHGAIWWAVANVLIGPCIDRWGFKVMYASALISATVCFLAISSYIKGVDNMCLDEEDSDESHHCGNGGYLSTNDAVEIPAFNLTDSFVEEINHPADSQEKVPFSVLFMSICGTMYGASYVFASFTLSMGVSVVESLIFLYFEFLGGSNTICGLTVAITVIFEIPIFHVAPKLLRLIGPGMMMAVAMIAYVVRVLGYTFIPDDHIWYVLLLEPLHGVTYAFKKISVVEFAERLMPDGSEASGQGIFATFGGLGWFFGLSIGGWTMQVFGPRTMYRYSASIVLFGLFIFGIASWWIRTQQKNQNSESEDKRTNLKNGERTKLVLDISNPPNPSDYKTIS